MLVLEDARSPSEKHQPGTRSRQAVCLPSPGCQVSQVPGLEPAVPWEPTASTAESMSTLYEILEKNQTVGVKGDEWLPGLDWQVRG